MALLVTCWNIAATICDWQFRKAGFTSSRVEYSQMQHSPPTHPFDRSLGWGIRYMSFTRRDNLIARYAPQPAVTRRVPRGNDSI